MLRLVLVCCTLVTSAILASSASCPTGWQQFNSKCYWVSDYKLHWKEVEDMCNSVHEGAEPVSIHDFLLNAWLTEKVLAGKHLVWIGLHRTSTDADWTWLDGSTLNFTRWDCGQPDSTGEVCGVLFVSSGMWHDVPCDLQNNFLCQRDMSQ